MKKIIAVLFTIMFMFAPLSAQAFTVLDEVQVVPQPQASQARIPQPVVTKLPANVASKKDLNDLRRSRERAESTILGKYEAVAETFNFLKKEVSDQKRSIGTLAGKVSSQETAIGNMEGKVSSQETAIGTLARKVSSQEVSVNSLKEKTDKLDARTNDHDTKLTYLEESTKGLFIVGGIILIALVAGGIFLYTRPSISKEKNPVEKSTEVPVETRGDSIAVAQIIVAIDKLGKNLEEKMDNIPGKVVSEMKKLDPTPFVFTLDYDGVKWQVTWDAYDPAENCYDLIFVHSGVSDEDELHPEAFKLMQEFESQGVARRGFERVMKKFIKYLVSKATIPTTTQEKVQVAVIKHLRKIKRLKIEMA